MFGYRAVGRSAVRIFARVCILVVLALSLSAAAYSQTRAKRVLVLYSYDREEAVFTDFEREMRSELTARLHERVEFYTEDLDIARFSSAQYAQDLAKLLQAKYSSVRPDLIVPVSYGALKFILGEGENQDSFRGIPVVCLLNTRSIKSVQLAAADRFRNGGITGVATTDEATPTIDLALRLQPETKNIAIVSGSSAAELAELQELQRAFAPYADRAKFSYLEGLTMDSLLARVRALPPQTIILNTYFFQDATGQFFLPEEALDLISHASSVPVYALDATDVGHGVVGGHMTDPAHLGFLVAGLAARVMNGENASSIPIVSDHSAKDMVDWREMKRWNINEKNLPAGAVELFREPTAWERYRFFIVGAIFVVAIETSLVLALIVNLKRLKRVERALLREKTLVDAVIEGLPGSFTLQDEAAKNIRWNKNSDRVLRYPANEVPRLGNVAEHDRGAAEQARNEVLAHGQVQVELDMLTADGGTTPYYFSGVRVDLEGKRYIAAVGLDVGPLKRAEKALRTSEAQLRSFVENAPYGIARASVKEDRFLSANPALVKMLGYESEREVLSLTLSRDLYLHGDSTGFRAQPTRADYFRGVDFIWKRKDGKPTTVRASGRRLPGQDGGDILEIIVEDVTTRRELEERLRQAQKMEALGQLAGSTAHDFNNLLSVIIGHCELLASTVHGQDPAKSRVEIIRRAGERAASLTSQLLAFSRRQVLQPRTLNLNMLVTETNKMLEHLMGEDIEHRLELDPKLGRVKADSGQMVQVLMNLAVNARDAMPKGGTLAIATTTVTIPEGTVMQGVAVPAGSYVTLSVSDTGIGMDAETQTHLFEPFFTTKPAGKGTGLGLATVFGIVKQSGGFIFAESEIGKGTIFRIHLPQVESAAESVGPQNAYLPSKNSGTILLVEDEPAFRDLLIEGLRAAGYRVLVGENGVDALLAAEQHSERIDLLLTDVIMPQMSGPDLARCLKDVHPEAAVLYMSGYADDKLQDLSIDDEVALLQKPFYIQDLLRKLHEILNYRGDASSSAAICDEHGSRAV